MSHEILPSGIKPLDEALKGGFPKPSNFLIIGAPLSIKTELGMVLLNGGLERGEGAIYVSTSHTAEEIRLKWADNGFKSEWEQEGRVKFVDCYSRTLGIGALDTSSISRVPSILDYTKLAVAVNGWCSNFNTKTISVRVLIDSLSSFLIYSSLQTVMRFLHIFLGQLRKQNVLGFFLLEEGTHDQVTFNQLKTFSNGAIILDQNTLRLEGYPGSLNVSIPFTFSSNELCAMCKMEASAVS